MKSGRGLWITSLRPVRRTAITESAVEGVCGTEWDTRPRRSRTTPPAFAHFVDRDRNDVAVRHMDLGGRAARYESYNFSERAANTATFSCREHYSSSSRLSSR